MSHTIEKRWEDLSGLVTQHATSHLRATVLDYELYLRVKDVYLYCGNDDTQFANLLFMNDKDLTTASADQITMATELFDAVKVFDMHNDFMNNVAVITKDRAKDLRNMA